MQSANTGQEGALTRRELKLKTDDFFGSSGFSVHLFYSKKLMIYPLCIRTREKMAARESTGPRIKSGVTKWNTMVPRIEHVQYSSFPISFFSTFHFFFSVIPAWSLSWTRSGTGIQKKNY